MRLIWTSRSDLDPYRDVSEKIQVRKIIGNEHYDAYEHVKQWEEMVESITGIHPSGTEECAPHVEHY